MSDKPTVVVFVDGVHYPVDKDGAADLKRPLRWENGEYRAARKGEPLHNDTHHASDLELEPGGEN